jgi:hypothetical protein
VLRTLRSHDAEIFEVSADVGVGVGLLQRAAALLVDDVARLTGVSHRAASEDVGEVRGIREPLRSALFVVLLGVSLVALDRGAQVIASDLVISHCCRLSLISRPLAGCDVARSSI